MPRKPKQTTAPPVVEVEKTPETPPVLETDAAPPAAEGIRPLFFDSSGWCPELKRSYFRGRYQPKTAAEFEALKKYAKGE